jgi:hypothetical protein
MAYGLFDMPIEVSFAMAFTFVTVAAAILVPGMMSITEKGYGKKKGIGSLLIAGCTFDTILCIIGFGITRAITFDKAG